jgi:hypothetical protein
MATSPSILISNERRQFLRTAGTATLSATAVALLVGCESMARNQAANPAEDAKILNVALGLEHEAIMAYQLGAESGLLQKPALDAAVLFQSHHKEHAAALESTIRKLGGTPAAPKSKAEVAAALNASSLRTGNDVLMLASRLERGAANAYIGVIPSLNDPQLAKVAAQIAADESLHWTTLQNVLQQPLPAKAFIYGA